MSRHLCALLVVSLFATVAPAAAQSPWPRTPPEPPFGSAPRQRRAVPQPAAPVSIADVPRHALSFTPGAFLFLMPNAEYELRTVRYLTVGVSASRSIWMPGRMSSNREMLARVYPAGLAFNGVALGLRTGRTHIDGLGTFRSVGLEGIVTKTAAKRAYMSVSVGGRRVLGAPDGFFGAIQPMVRMNVGLGF